MDVITTDYNLLHWGEPGPLATTFDNYNILVSNTTLQVIAQWLNS